jgi:PleD family two-component response regulator
LNGRGSVSEMKERGCSSMTDWQGAAAPRILIADDQTDVLEALRLLLKGEGYQIEAVTSPAAVIAALETRDFDVVIMDLNYTRDTTSGKKGWICFRAFKPSTACCR